MMNISREKLINLSLHSKVFVSIAVSAVLFIIAYWVSYKISVFDVNVRYLTPEGYEYEVTERHYWGAFYWKKTWYVWVMYILVLSVVQFVLWNKNTSK